VPILLVVTDDFRISLKRIILFRNSKKKLLSDVQNI